MILMEVAEPPDAPLTLWLSSTQVRAGRIAHTDAVEVVGTETELAEGVQAVAHGISSDSLPCHVDVAAIEVTHVTVRIPALESEHSAFPLFLPPGEHALEVSAPGRSPFSGTLTCEPGKRYRIRVQ